MRKHLNILQSHSHHFPLFNFTRVLDGESSASPAQVNKAQPRECEMTEIPSEGIFIAAARDYRREKKDRSRRGFE